MLNSDFQQGSDVHVLLGVYVQRARAVAQIQMQTPRGSIWIYRARGLCSARARAVTARARAVAQVQVRLKRLGAALGVTGAV